MIDKVTPEGKSLLAVQVGLLLPAWRQILSYPQNR
jgi:hypothetical protein